MHLMLPALAAAALALLYRAAYAVAYRGDALRLLLTVLLQPTAAFEARTPSLVRLVPSNSKHYAALIKALQTTRIMLLSFIVQGEAAYATVLGETGNVYEIVFSARPWCSCPNFASRQGDTGPTYCKHIAWLKLKVMGVPANHYLASQNAYLRLEVRYLLAKNPQAVTGVMAPLGVREALGLVPTRVVTTSRCTICFDDDLHEVPPEGLVACAASCRTAYHAACVTAYHKSLAGDGKQLICPCCRHKWVHEVAVTTETSRLGTPYRKVTYPQPAKRNRK